MKSDYEKRIRRSFNRITKRPLWLSWRHPELAEGSRSFKNIRTIAGFLGRLGMTIKKPKRPIKAMSDFRLTQKQENLFIKILLAIFFVFVFLIILRYFLGVKVLRDSEKQIEALKKILTEQQQPTLEAPIVRTTDPRLGSAKAENIIVVFSDFQCPYCADMMGALNQLITKYPSKILLIWKDFAIPQHPQAKNAAIAARCAQVQDKFWEYHSYLYANQDKLKSDLYKQIASQIGLDENKFNQCYNNQETLPLVEDEFQEGLALKIDATPYLFVNGERVSGAVDFQDLEKMIK